MSVTTFIGFDKWPAVMLTRSAVSVSQLIQSFRAELPIKLGAMSDGPFHINLSTNLFNNVDGVIPEFGQCVSVKHA